MRAALTFLMTLAFWGSAQAALTPAEISEVGVSPPSNAQAPLRLQFRDDADRPTTLGAALGAKPAVLIFADYTCTSLCGPALVLARAGLEASGLKPGSDYRLVVVGLNPKDGPPSALKMRRERLADDAAIDRASAFLVGDPEAVRTATRAFGYRYIYDPEHDQFAHPAVAFALAPSGRLARVVPEIGLTGPALRSAVLEAGENRTGGLIGRLHLLCYGFDPASGIYNRTTILVVRTAAVGFLALAAGALVLMSRRRRAQRS